MLPRNVSPQYLGAGGQELGCTGNKADIEFKNIILRQLI